MGRMKTKVDEVAVADAYRDGATLQQCKERFGVCVATVSRILRDQGVQTRPRGRRKVAD